MKKYYKILFIAIFIFLGFSKAFGDDYLFYKCNNKELKIKALYFYTQNAYINKPNTIKKLQRAGYKNLASSFDLATKNLTCKIGQNIYKVTIGGQAGNPNPMGNCGAFFSHWIIITKNNKIILPRTLFQSCNSESAISEIAINSNSKMQILTTKPYENTQTFQVIKPNNIKVVDVGSAISGITADKFGNVWTSSYVGKFIAKINQDEKVTYYNINAHPLSIASDSKGNIFILTSEGYIVKLNQEGRIIETYEVPLLHSNADHIFIDPHNNIWVGSWISRQILELSENGKLIKTYQLESASDPMSMDKAGNLWIIGEYGGIEILYPNGYIKKCSLKKEDFSSPIATQNNTAWVVEGKLINDPDNPVVLIKHINYNCQILPQTYRLNIQPAGLAIDSNSNLWVSGNMLHGGGFLKELNNGKVKHTYSLGKSASNLIASDLVIDKYGNVWVVAGENADRVIKFTHLFAQTHKSPQPPSGLNPHLPIAIHHTFPENNIGK
ncbi:hypothetical protein [Desulfurella sp.]|uniref:Vgb family protein n=1 Tax=Desulfurella sp. TaxID=1962857 RepID=UPI003D0E4DDA